MTDMDDKGPGASPPDRPSLSETLDRNVAVNGAANDSGGETGESVPGAGGPAGTAQAQLNPGDAAAPGTPGTGENICPECAGSGRRGADACPNCGGTGKVIEGIGGA